MLGKLVVSLGVAVLLAFAGSVHAVLITSNGMTYNVTTVTGSFSELETRLQAQPWWTGTSNSFDLADDLAEQVEFQLGVQPFNSSIGPAFAYAIGSASGNAETRAWFNFMSGPDTGPLELTPSFTEDFSVSWAVVPEPTTVALMGLGLAGVGLSRRKTN